MTEDYDFKGKKNAWILTLTLMNIHEGNTMGTLEVSILQNSKINLSVCVYTYSSRFSPNTTEPPASKNLWLHQKQKQKMKQNEKPKKTHMSRQLR